MDQVRDELEVQVRWKGTGQDTQSSFADISQNRESVESVELVWNENSYFVTLNGPMFLVNGGRPLYFPSFRKCNDLQILVVRRNRQDMTMNGEHVGDRRTSYLLGVQGYIGEETKELMVHVSPDGRSYEWKTRR